MQRMNDSSDRTKRGARRRSSAGPVLLGMLTGALAGAAAALLMAPRSGEEMKGELRERGQALRDDAERRISEGRNRAGATIRQARMTVAGWLDQGSSLLGDQASNLRSNEVEDKITAA